MVLYQYSKFEMHFGIVKNHGFWSKLFPKKIPVEHFPLIQSSVKFAYSARKKKSNRNALTGFLEIENHFRDWKLKQFQRKHEDVSLKNSSINAPRHF